jgi:hypothetical protein
MESLMIMRFENTAIHENTKAERTGRLWVASVVSYAAN